MKILMVLTSHDRLGETGHKTGFWLEEFAAPYYVFKDAGADLVLASPKGGQPPLDPKSDAPDAQTAATVRFNEDAEALATLATTQRLKDVVDSDFDAVFYPGGHGPLWDLAEDADSIRLVERAFSAGKPVAAVCHGPAVFRHTRGALGEPLVKDKRVTGFSNEEEAAVGLTGVVPFSLEDELRKNGARYERGAVWQSYVVTDGRLVTGQNPASSEAVAEDVLRLLR
ncbi:MAG: type 1 glutamine amidotransferase domain-containing protein [Xanthomonas sp.]|uniref:type 1 glutamine amidotransferase domain-containing protein n=1 Tax=Pseudoxanthomonas mexicana TaxID=128785 RepID=UPI000785794B|nr:type 1 glutamine amidotransferase domain-containing protein [Pseudoxanthomonas mexicana]MBA3928498.1 type 1 glutamine amidotransferase domain-containing protein [Xanthomonas sp.]MBL8256761.1 type 1 glutamine amidotransferase domain-containing protein [Pseudoxanthomonas mexicana]